MSALPAETPPEPATPPHTSGERVDGKRRDSVLLPLVRAYGNDPAVHQALDAHTVPEAVGSLSMQTGGAKLYSQLVYRYTVLRHDEVATYADAIQAGYEAFAHGEPVTPATEPVARAAAVGHQVLLTCNLRLALKGARNFNLKYGVDFEDLVQEANIGLGRAVRRYDRRKGYAFSTYATFWIHNALQLAVNKSRSMPLTQDDNDRYYRALAATKQAEADRGHQLVPTEISEVTGLSYADYQALLELGRLSLTSLNQPVAAGSDAELGELLPASEHQIERFESFLSDRQLVRHAMAAAGLSNEERIVLALLYGINPDVSPQTGFTVRGGSVTYAQARERILSEAPNITDVGTALGIGRPRVVKLVDAAMRKLKNQLALDPASDYFGQL